MKIKIQGFENEVIFDDSSINIIQTKNKKLYQNLTEKIFENTFENSLEIQLIDDKNEVVKFKDYVFFLTDLYQLNINFKSVITKLNDSILDYIRLDKKEEVENSIQKIRDVVIDEVQELPFEISIKEELNVSDILKLFGVKLDTEEYTDIMHRLKLIIKVLNYFKIAEILIIPNLKSILEEEQLVELYKFSLYNNIKLLIIESNIYNKLEYEKIFEIDESFNDNVF